MRETRLYGSEGGGAARSPYPYPAAVSRRRENEILVSSRITVEFMQTGCCFRATELSTDPMATAGTTALMQLQCRQCFRAVEPRRFLDRALA